MRGGRGGRWIKKGRGRKEVQRGGGENKGEGEGEGGVRGGRKCREKEVKKRREKIQR